MFISEYRGPFCHSVDAFLNYTVGEVSNGRLNCGCCVQKNMCVC